MKQVSKIVDGVRCVIGQATKKPNTVTMQVSKSFIQDAVKYFDALREGEEITEGLIGLELIAHYAGEEDEADEIEDKVVEITGTLEETIDEITDELSEAISTGDEVPQEEPNES